jgi:hypothetical protein
MFPLKPPSGGFHKWRYPIAGWFIIETPVKKMIWGYPLQGNLHMAVSQNNVGNQMA